jgi:hypothetical protein
LIGRQQACDTVLGEASRARGAPMVVLYVSISQSFNPFTLSRPALRRRFGHAGPPVPPGFRRVRRASAGILDAVSRPLPSRSAEEILALLPSLADIVAEVETDLTRWVTRLRDLGVGWDVIGAALQLGEDEVRQRFDAGP